MENKNLNNKLVEMLVNPSSNKEDIANLLIQNDVSISDTDLNEIRKKCLC